MFEESKRKKQEDIYHNPQEQEKVSVFSFNKIATILAVVIAVIVMAVFFIFKNKPSLLIKPGPKPDNNGNQAATSSKATGQLPSNFGSGNGNEFNFGTSTNGLKAEDITFGHFYKKEDDDFQSNIESYNLPINIKVDAANYHDISRKMDIDPYVKNINENGFVILKNQFSAQANDFFSVYRFLMKKEIPIVVTNDFLFYYYQNTLKEVYKEIEKNAFYENVWDINKKLFNIALARYKNRLSEVGLANDPVLEGERLELAYFAVALKLLMPTTQQINSKANFSDEDKFNEQEADIFYFSMPGYLKIDVEKEVGLIMEARKEAKSPVALYEKDYRKYAVPANYKSSAKLNNFYLATKWLNSVFPLYYKSDDCPRCLLDKDDWTVNMVAAGFIAKDLYDNQDLKNQWAIVYKFISFFSGLRQDLTYLQYYNTFVELFGENYSIEDIFSLSDQEKEQALLDIQEKIAGYSFASIEGSLSRENVKAKPLIGMRLLQEPYWPNKYVFNHLTGTDIELKIKKPDNDKNITACFSGEKAAFYRCGGFGMDIINLLHPIADGDDYFVNNTNYHNYNNKINSLRAQIDKFDVYTWNNNIYWATLDITKLLLDYDASSQPVFIRNNNWKEKKDFNTVLGAWVNLHLPKDQFINYFEQKAGGLGIFTECNVYNYIEPNINFVRELIVRNDMLINILTALKVTKKTNAASIMLKELNTKLQTVIDISKDELSDKPIDNDNCKFIQNLVSNYAIEKKGKKVHTVKFPIKSLTESIDGVKLLMIVYRNNNNKKVIAIGPVFNYSER